MKPILCNTQVVKNILAGRQTQDRRPIKPQPVFKNTTSHADDDYWGWSWKKNEKEWFAGVTKKQLVGHHGLLHPTYAPHQVGDVLYVRETWATNWPDEDKIRPRDLPETTSIIYRAEATEGLVALCRWRPNIHMPKWAARIFLKVTAVRVERIQDISGEDCLSEGVATLTELNAMLSTTSKTPFHVQNKVRAKKIFKDLWESCYPSSWERNDWVFVYEFEMCEKP